MIHLCVCEVDVTRVTRRMDSSHANAHRMLRIKVLGHHMEACFVAWFPHEGTGHGVAGVQEFITKVTEELQEERAMHGDHRPFPGVAPYPGENNELGICVNIPGLNKAASQECFWPSHVGRCEGPPHSYVRMPFGLPNAAVTFQRHLRSVLAAQEARHQAVLTEMVTVLHEPTGSREPPEVPGLGGS